MSNALRKGTSVARAHPDAVQGCGLEIIAKIDGSYTNVVGLPMEKTAAALTKFGVQPKSI